MKLIRIILMVAVAATAWIGEIDSAQACGPDFEIALLSDRSKTMLELPDGVFMEEVKRLLPTPSENKPVIKPSGTRDGGSEAERSLYDKGASLYHEGKIEGARSAFLAVLALPSEERQYRSTWATYMLGELDWPHEPSSKKYYQQVRQLVSEGFRDDLGLAAASLGQEAYLHLHPDLHFSGEEPTDVLAALDLYAEQAALGHEGGAISLLLLVREAVADKAVPSFAESEIGRSLLGIYLYTRRHELTGEEAALLFTILSEFPPEIGATRLAAAAYREGRWQMAQKLAAYNPDDNLSKWVLSKLALRAGDKARSEKLHSEIFTNLSGKLALCDEYSRTRVSAENAVWALREGLALLAMQHAWDASLPGPMSDYIAERVLSLAELRGFVTRMPKARDGDDAEFSEEESWERFGQKQLRSIFARRLMRAGFRELREQKFLLALYHFQESQSYFEGDEKMAASKLSRWLLVAYRSADPIEQADALYRASQLARSEGLEVLGTSDAPDWASQYAQYDMSEYWYVDSSEEWMGDAERQRLVDSAPLSNQRYHYRQLASELAEQAADVLPIQSQAFAATLCHASRYIFNTDRTRVGHLWNRYVQDGPAVEFSGSFGIHCPAPEFVSARRYLKKPAGAKWPWLAGALVGILALAAAAWRLGRRSVQRGPIGDLDKIQEKRNRPRD